MKTISQYVILSHTHAAGLQKLVEQHLKEGYELHGGLCVSNGMFYQAVIWLDYDRT